MATIQQNSSLNMNDRNAMVTVDGNFKTNVSNCRYTTLTAGILKVSGNLTEGNYSYKSLANTDNFLIKLDGDKIQKIAVHSQDVVFCNLDLSESKGVVFESDVRISRLNGWDKIRGDELDLRDSTINITDNTTLNTNLILINSSLNLGANEMEIKGDVEQYNSTLRLSNGKLKIDGNYSITGTGYLYMVNENDRLEVTGDFETGSSINHCGMLKAGTFSLGGNFHQWGNEYSFRATDDHLMVFIGRGAQKQQVYMENRPESAFSNVRVDGTGYYSAEEGNIFFKSITASVISGITSAVDEEWEAIENLASSPTQQLEFLSLLGLSVVQPAIGKILFEAIIAGNVTMTVVETENMLLSDADRYTKAEFVAKQITHLLILAATIKGIDKVCEILKSREATSRLLNTFQLEGKFLSDSAVGFALKELPEQKALCQNLVSKEAATGLDSLYVLEAAERAQLYDVLKTVAQEKKSNLFELEMLFTKLSEEGATLEASLRWLERARCNLVTNTACTYEELCTYLRRLDKAYEKDFIENANWPDGVKFPTTKAQLINGLDKHLLKLEKLRAELPEKYQKLVIQSIWECW